MLPSQAEMHNTILCENIRFSNQPSGRFPGTDASNSEGVLFPAD